MASGLALALLSAIAMPVWVGWSAFVVGFAWWAYRQVRPKAT